MSFFQSSIKNIMGPPSNNGTDKDDDVVDAGRGRGEKFEEAFEDLDGLYGKGGKDDVKNAGGEGAEANLETNV